MTAWTPRFSLDQIPTIAGRYTDPGDDAVIEAGQRSQAQGLVSYEDFLKMCRWKTVRSQSRCRKNTVSEVEEATRIALSATSDRVRIGVLRSLEGVEWPTASVILHFAHADPYPILDFRALWSLGVEQPTAYNFNFWQKYVSVCRNMAQQSGVSMRTLDQALWQHSKENQPTKFSTQPGDVVITPPNI